MLPQIESLTYKAIQEKPFTKIHESLTWLQKEQLIPELEELYVDIKVYYKWAGNYDPLTMIIVATRYLSETQNKCVAPNSTTNRHKDITTRSTQAQLSELTTENDILGQNWPVVSDWKK